MLLKRIKCILTGGCRFKGIDESHLDIEKDTYTVKPICYKCGKQYSYTVPYSKLIGYTEYLHDTQKEN